MVPLDARIKLEVSQSWSSKGAIVDIVVHVISLGIVRRFESRLDLGQAFHAGDIKHVTSLADLDTARLTQFGWDFVRAAVEARNCRVSSDVAARSVAVAECLGYTRCHAAVHHHRSAARYQSRAYLSEPSVAVRAVRI
jgi:hypothetical protein